MNGKSFSLSLLILLSFAGQVFGYNPFSSGEGAKHYALDLGTRFSVLFESGNPEPLFNEASAMSFFDGDKKKIDKIGNDALKLLEKCPEGKKAVRMIQDGTIQSVWQATMFLKGIFDKAKVKPTSNSYLVVGIPGVIKTGEALSIEKAAERIGFSRDKIFLVREPIAALIGEGRDIFTEKAVMVGDGGGGTFDILVVGQGGILSNSERTFSVAGDAMDKAIKDYVADKFSVEISLEQAESLKRELGIVFSMKQAASIDRSDTLFSRSSGAILSSEDNKSQIVVAKDPLKKRIKEIEVTREDVSRALEGCIKRILDEFHAVIHGVGPDAAQDIMEGGILFAGGASMIPGFAERIQQETNIPTQKADDSLLAVGNGLRMVVEDIDSYRSVMMQPDEF